MNLIKNVATEKEMVIIEVNSNFGKLLSLGEYHTFNAGYNIGSTYYDIEVEINSPLWKECLWNQVNFSVEGLTEKEFILPMYSWLHKLIPTNLGSNRRDEHSAFSWCNSFSIIKKGSRIILNEGQSEYTTSGKKVLSSMDKELINAEAKAPANVPHITGKVIEYGTTVTLWEDSTYLKAFLNATIVLGNDKENIKSSYCGRDNINWAKDYNIVGYPTMVGVISCISVENFSNNYDDTDPTFMWLFPNKGTYVPLGHKKSFALLKKLGGEIPEWLEEKVKGLTSGEGWKVLN